MLLLFISENNRPDDSQGRLMSHLHLEYGYRDNETFEFIGDTILNFMIVRLMMDMRVVASPDTGTKVKNLVTKNVTLGCLLDYKFLCRERFVGDARYENSKTPVNKCADVFEAIIGGLFWYLDIKLQLQDPIKFLQDWLISIWPIKSMIMEAVRFNRITCPIPTEEQLREAALSLRSQQRSPMQEIIVIDDEDERHQESRDERHEREGERYIQRRPVSPPGQFVSRDISMSGPRGQNVNPISNANPSVNPHSNVIPRATPNLELRIDEYDPFMDLD